MFLSCQNALYWAYGVAERSIIKSSMINHMRGPSAPCGASNSLIDDLSIQDRHGQAALILGAVDKLDDAAARDYIKARFGRRIDLPEIRYLVYRCCDSLGVGLEKHDGVYRVLKAYFLGQLSIRTIRREIGCRHQHAIMNRNCLYDTIDIIHHRAIADLEQAFERQGLIRGRERAGV